MTDPLRPEVRAEPGSGMPVVTHRPGDRRFVLSADPSNRRGPYDDHRVGLRACALGRAGGGRSAGSGVARLGAARRPRPGGGPRGDLRSRCGVAAGGHRGGPGGAADAALAADPSAGDELDRLRLVRAGRRGAAVGGRRLRGACDDGGVSVVAVRRDPLGQWPRRDPVAAPDHRGGRPRRRLRLHRARRCDRRVHRARSGVGVGGGGAVAPTRAGAGDRTGPRDRAGAPGARPARHGRPSRVGHPHPGAGGSGHGADEPVGRRRCPRRDRGRGVAHAGRDAHHRGCAPGRHRRRGGPGAVADGGRPGPVGRDRCRGPARAPAGRRRSRRARAGRFDRDLSHGAGVDHQRPPPCARCHPHRGRRLGRRHCRAPDRRATTAAVGSVPSTARALRASASSA